MSKKLQLDKEKLSKLSEKKDNDLGNLGENDLGKNLEEKDKKIYSTEFQHNEIPNPKIEKNNKKKKKAKKNKDHNLTAEEIEIQKRYRSLKMKKTGLLLGLFLFVLAILGSNFYLMYLKTDKSPLELATSVNSVNRTTSFPEYGVLSYLKKNANELIKNKVVFDQGVQEAQIDTNTIEINFISKRTTKLANVYFRAMLKTPKGANWHNFMVPLNFDYDLYAYTTAGDLQLSPVKSADSVQQVENDLFTFRDIEMMNKKDLASISVFLTNLFVITYNENGDYSQYYTGSEKLGDTGVEFLELVKVEVYKANNAMGLNGKIQYKVKLKEGVIFTTTSYIKIEPNGNSWILKRIL